MAPYEHSYGEHFLMRELVSRRQRQRSLVMRGKMAPNEYLFDKQFVMRGITI